jgi:hypothetical protein
MQKKRLALRALLVSGVVCLLLSVFAAVKVWVPEEYRWLARPVANIASPLASILIVLWISLRHMPGEKLLLDREEIAILRGAPWWFIFSVMAVLGLAIWIGTWASWWAGQRYLIQ